MPGQKNMGHLMTAALCLAVCALGGAGCRGQNKDIGAMDRTESRTLVGIAYEQRVGMVYGADEDYAFEAGRMVYARYYSPEEAGRLPPGEGAVRADGGYLVVEDAALEGAVWDSLEVEVMRLMPQLKEVPTAKAVSFLKKLLPEKMLEETDGPNYTELCLVWEAPDGERTRIRYNAASGCGTLLELMRSAAAAVCAPLLGLEPRTP